MSKELKFKIWDKQSRKFWNEGKGYSLLTLAMSYREIIACPEKFQLIEFTGLLDKNGVEIYDGDICYAKKPNSYLDGNYEVRWHDTKGRWYYANQRAYKDLYQVGCAGNLKCEVVGHINEGSSILS
jgi:hypothetical protein